MANIKVTPDPGPGPTWIDMSQWDFRSLSDSWRLHVSELNPGNVRIYSDFDPYALVARFPPSWQQMNIVGSGFGAPDAAGFPTVGHVSGLILFSSLDHVTLEIYGIDQTLGSVLAAFHAGRTSDLVAMITGGDDVIQGSNSNNNPFGIEIGDVILGGRGDDTLIGHGGHDNLQGGDGDDLFSTVDHTTNVYALGSAATVDGGAGFNTVTYADAPGRVTADLSGATGTTDVLKNIQKVIGSPFADQLRGSAAADYLVGGGGEDTLIGGAGDDTLDGGAFWGDVTRASPHNVLWGGDGDDLIRGDLGFNQINGNAGDDHIVGRSQVGDWLLGGQGADSIDAAASTGNNILNGNLGNDTLIGGSGADSLRGGQGDDVIHAGSGSDWISGDLGTNTIYGGQGVDVFHAGAGHDLINAWHGGDHIQVGLGVTWQASQVNGDVHITFSNGGEMDLIGVQQASLQAGWIVST